MERLFIWHPGEYVMELVVEAEPGSATYAKKYRYTLYESDTAELLKHAEDYQHGAGITYNVDRHRGLSVTIAEHWIAPRVSRKALPGCLFAVDDDE